MPKALGDFLVLDAVRETGGTAVAVTDEELLAAQVALARDEGTWICPEGAACFAAVAQLRETGGPERGRRGGGAQHRHRPDLPGHGAVDGVPVLAKDGRIP